MTGLDLDALVDAYLTGDDPLPGSAGCFVGDGDYRAIGGEFLRHFVRLGGLAPGEGVFEIGCGIGRMALPLRRYLSADGRYHGMDVVAHGIEWCRTEIAALDPRFRFSHHDLYHPLYNPSGRETATKARLPAEDDSIDFLVATSVFTHLSRPVFERYIDEAARVLAPGGRFFATFFLINPASRAAAAEGRTRYPFDLDEPGPLFRPRDDLLLSSVAADETWLLERCSSAGLALHIPIQHGFWPSEDPARGVSYQDVCVLERRG